jgi:hypothetical protein
MSAPRRGDNGRNGVRFPYRHCIVRDVCIDDDSRHAKPRGGQRCHYTALPSLTDHQRCAVVHFNRLEPPEFAALYGDLAAADLLPVLRALVARIEAGTLRMPVDGGARWTEAEE